MLSKREPRLTRFVFLLRIKRLPQLNNSCSIAKLVLLKASNSPSSKQQPRDALILRFPPCVTSTESRKLEPSPRKGPGMSLVCFRKPGSRKVGLRAGSRQRQLLIGHDMGLTVALTNGNKELPSGPAHRRNRRRWRHPRPSRPDTAPGGGLATLEAYL